ncbi:mitochondrial DNA helicase [Neocloeon triangulifer]|uniref:mitochondrial DNA helicase n=1 Tax=Neocloeon triangulifer TaxID=2078957 RepID=UPI00286F4168|nr:mitochondrial DNA helicase [Neocloeon triangulifer]
MASHRRVIYLARRMFGVSSASRTTIQSVTDVPTVYVSRMKYILEGNRLPFEDGFTCLTVPTCPVGCEQKPPKGKFFINKTTGLFVCHACGQTGSWRWLEKRLMDQTKNGASLNPPSFPHNESSKSQSEPVPENIMSRCEPASIVTNKVLNKCLQKLNIEHVQREHLALLGALVGPAEILLPLRGPCQNIGAWKHLYQSSDETKNPAEALLGVKSLGQLLLSNEEAWKTDKVALVASGADLLALTSQKIPAICLDSQHLPQEVLPRLEHFKTISIWFGEHQLQAKRVARKLGISRCKMIRAPELLNGPHSVLLAKEPNSVKLSAQLQQAENLTHPAVVSFSTLRGEVLDAVTRRDASRGMPWSRFPQLTATLGGFRDGELTVMTGPTGSGKTTFLSEYSLDLCMQGMSTLWGSFEIRNTRLAKTMLTQMAGMNLETNLNRFDEFADKMEQLPLYFLDFHGQQPLKTVLNAVNHAQYVYDLGHVIIDNVQFMLGLGDSESKFIDRFYRQDQVIQAFRAFASATNCHVTLVIHPRKERADEDLTSNSIFGSAKASQEADNILIIQITTTADKKQRKFLQVAKNRYTGELGLMPLSFNRESLSFVRKKVVPKVNDAEKSEEKKEPENNDLTKLGKSKVDDFELFLKTHANVLK